jgi:peptide/nickel transport system substrate-binding protein
VSTASLGAAAAFLAACGGDDDDAGSTGNAGSNAGGGSGNTGGSAQSGLISELVDTTSSLKRGGVKKFFINSDIVQGFDVHIGSSAMEAVQTPSMGTLLIDKPGYMGPRDFTQEGDVAESWEFSPDRLTLTMKLRPNVKFAPLDPVNGRVLDVDDVLFSWDRFGRVSPSRNDLVNTVNPNAPVLSLEAPDASTIVIKLKAPSSIILPLFSAHNSGKLQIFPKEADSQYDPKKKLIGSGPYYLAEYNPSEKFVLKRNPGFYSDEVGFIDEIQMPILSEYASALAQLKAGNIYSYQNAGTGLVLAEDILSTKNDVPQLNMYASQLVTTGFRTFFGLQPEGQSPWRDERVRQAYSMALDRDLFIETVYNVSNFTAEGLPVDTAYNSALNAGTYQGWWLDPQSADFGENAKFFQYNLDEAKKLLNAAGYPDGFETTSVLVAGNEYGTAYPTQVEIIEGMVGEIGIRHQHRLVDYATEFQFDIRDAHGNFEGLSYKLGPQASAPEPTGQLLYDYHSKASTGWYGFDASGQGRWDAGDPDLDAMIDKAVQEFDVEARRQMVFEMQRYLGKTQYGVRWPGGASGFLLAWPVLGNFNVYQNDPRRESVREWIDETKAPINKS